MIEQFFNDIKNNNISKKNNLIEIIDKQVFLYGAGNIGKKMAKSLIGENINLIGFLDKNNNLPRVIQNLHVYFPEDIILDKYKKNAIVILTGFFDKIQSKQIKEYLYGLGFKNVFCLHEVNLKITKMILSEYRYTSNEVEVLQSEDDIKKAYYLLQSEDDKKFYIDYIKSNILFDYSYISNPLELDLQYLAHDIDENKDYTTFIDCGAYDGDTIRNLFHKNISIKNIIAFEPQKESYTKLSETINNIESIDMGILIPCGVYDEAKTLRFTKNKESLSSSSINENGEEIIQCTSIDKCIKGIKPTFIKMDIEGAEINALKGAKETIKKYRPQLAICVYHSLSHIWEIPLLIHEIDPTYKFYLRNYNYMGIETVLYAF